VRPNEITRCSERALLWPSTVEIRGIVLFLFILVLVTNRFAVTARVRVL
jgi:hypothetical protein